MLDETYTMARYDAMSRADFAAFAHRAFCELNPRASFAMNWHYEAIAAKLAAVYPAGSAGSSSMCRRAI